MVSSVDELSGNVTAERSEAPLNKTLRGAQRTAKFLKTHFWVFDEKECGDDDVL